MQSNPDQDKLQQEVAAKHAETKAFVEEILLQTKSCHLAHQNNPGGSRWVASNSCGRRAHPLYPFFLTHHFIDSFGPL